jgi:hypothetical protein
MAPTLEPHAMIDDREPPFLVAALQEDDVFATRPSRVFAYSLDDVVMRDCFRGQGVGCAKPKRGVLVNFKQGAFRLREPPSPVVLANQLNRAHATSSF